MDNLTLWVVLHDKRIVSKYTSTDTCQSYRKQLKFIQTIHSIIDDILKHILYVLYHNPREPYPFHGIFFFTSLDQLYDFVTSL